ncbi:MAG: sugar ABC transporter substrate-binding protein [Nocardioides sp.]
MSSLIRRVAVAGAALTLGAGGLAACSSSSNSSSSGSSNSPSGSAQAPTAAYSLTSPPKSGAAAPPTGGTTTKVSGKVGVILPDTTSSTRYTLYDAPLLKKSLSAAGITPDVQNAGGSTSKFASIAQSMIGEGVKVLIIDSIDAPSGAGVEKQAAAAGVKVIDYDRVNLGGTAPYYVSFDNEDVGKLQAQTMVDCLNKTGVKDPQIIMMDGGKDVDNNAVLFAKGAHEVLDPLQAAGKLKIVSESVVKGWTVANAAPTFTQALTAAGGKVDGVLAANDDIANAVIGVLKSTGLNGHVVVTGQDSGVEGLQNIITGQQSMTVFKNVKLEADAASKLAISLISGKDPSAAGLTLVKFQDPQAPNHNLKALLLPAQVITQANIKDVVNAGALTTAEICKNITAQCAKLGLS